MEEKEKLTIQDAENTQKGVLALAKLIGLSQAV